MNQLNDVALLPRPRHVNPAASHRLPAQGYRITIRERGAQIESADPAGEFYAEQTMEQLRRLCGDAIPRGVIEDWPDFPVRGVMLDISRDKVPKMETLYSLVDLWAELKFNRLELYTEHTFAYARHRTVWENASPMTADELRALNAYCRDRFIELAPNQNTFGHMHRWLIHAAYRDLAECPDGYVTPWGEKRTEPATLNPLDPRSLALVRELLDELLPNFMSRSVNVGGDETFDLGQGRSKSECERIGKGRVYLNYLMQLHELVRKRGHIMHFWGDIILNHPELIPELPRDVVPLVWGYESNHPFADQCASFARAGFKFYVCPGTSGWNAIAGRADNCIGNILSAAENGLTFGADGFLLTDWGDGGHWHPLPVSFLGYAVGASASWCRESNHANDWAEALDLHFFRDKNFVMGRVAMDLGNAYLQTGRTLHNASALFRLLHQDDIGKLSEEIGRAALERIAEIVSTVRSRISQAKMERADKKLIEREFDLASKMLLAACHRGLDLDKASRATDLSGILSEHISIWSERNRPGGLPDSCARIERRLSECSA